MQICNFFATFVQKSHTFTQMGFFFEKKCDSMSQCAQKKNFKNTIINYKKGIEK